MTADRPLPALLTALLAGLVLTACTAEESPSPDLSASSQTTREPSEAPTADDRDGSTALESAGPDDAADGAEPDAPAQPTAQPPREPQAPETDQGGVEVVVTYAGPGSDPRITEVVAYLPDVIEESGTCTATVVGTQTTASAPAWPDVSSTSCGLIELASEPAPGQEVVVSYASPTSSGTSATVEVTP